MALTRSCVFVAPIAYKVKTLEALKEKVKVATGGDSEDMASFLERAILKKQEKARLSVDPLTKAVHAASEGAEETLPLPSRTTVDGEPVDVPSFEGVTPVVEECTVLEKARGKGAGQRAQSSERAAPKRKHQEKGGFSGAAADATKRVRVVEQCPPPLLVTEQRRLPDLPELEPSGQQGLDAMGKRAVALLIDRGGLSSAIRPPADYEPTPELADVQVLAAKMFKALVAAETAERQIAEDAQKARRELAQAESSKIRAEISDADHREKLRIALLHIEEKDQIIAEKDQVVAKLKAENDKALGDLEEQQVRAVEAETQADALRQEKEALEKRVERLIGRAERNKAHGAARYRRSPEFKRLIGEYYSATLKAANDWLVKLGVFSEEALGQAIEAPGAPDLLAPHEDPSHPLFISDDATVGKLFNHVDYFSSTGEDDDSDRSNSNVSSPSNRSPQSIRQERRRRKRMHRRKVQELAEDMTLAQLDYNLGEAGTSSSGDEYGSFSGQ